VIETLSPRHYLVPASAVLLPCRDRKSPGADRRLPVQFFRVWVVLWVVVAAGLELTTRTPYQRVMLAGGLAGSPGCGDCYRSGLRRS